jgi:AraC family transcriptional regulator, regulatory protein of adaptative response / DNA-3-methyladenine glycosylase II
MNFDRTACYVAMRARDRRFDGRFFVGVHTTGIYCRPICPAPTPKLANVDFYACAAAAEDAGFRPCRRCRPETAPGTPAWVGSSAVVARALRLIRAGALDETGVPALAERLGIGSRQLRRLFEQHLGTSPATIARQRRVHFARVLLDASDLSMTAVAYAAGFRSVRQFNHAVRTTFRETPRAMRRRRRHGPVPGEPLTIRLPYRPPFDWPALMRFFAARATPGVEAVRDGRYHRTVAIDGAVGAITVEPAEDSTALLVRLRVGECNGVLEVVERVRRVFDLDADPMQIGSHLACSPILRPLVAAAPGMRVPGAWEPFELAVRGILGQQVTVAAATTLSGRLAAAFGAPIDAGDGLTHLFPTPQQLLDADIASIGMPRARAESLRALAAAVAGGTPLLDASLGYDAAVERLCALPGIGAWTAQYIAMRALGEPDAFPAGDLGVRKALGNGAGPLPAAAVEQLSLPWRPWRAYAVMYLWASLSKLPPAAEKEHDDDDTTARRVRHSARRSEGGLARATAV